MDILIKNMELPHTVTIYPNGDIDELIDGKYVTIGKAIELPPYGRLIDADELEKVAEKMAVCDSYEYTIAHEMVKKLLEIAPTVLEANNG